MDRPNTITASLKDEGRRVRIRKKGDVMMETEVGVLRGPRPRNGGGLWKSKKARKDRKSVV